MLEAARLAERRGREQQRPPTVMFFELLENWRREETNS
jgi:hypothetical protein